MSGNEDKSNPSPFGLFSGKKPWLYCPCDVKVEDERLRLFVAVFANILQPFTQIQHLMVKLTPKTNVDALRSTLLQALVKYKFVNFFLSMLKKKILQIITVIPLYNLLR